MKEDEIVKTKKKSIPKTIKNKLNNNQKNENQI
jgi:hypothetical protein